MHPDRLNAELEREPFLPFRVHFTDGRTVDILNPGLTYIYGSAFHILEPFKRGRITRGFRIISLRQIVSIKPIEPTAPAAA